MITHRCKGSLNNRLSIRYENPYAWRSDIPRTYGWQLYYNYYDSEWMVYMNRLVASYIKYCPYCGEKLKERETK